MTRCPNCGAWPRDQVSGPNCAYCGTGLSAAPHAEQAPTRASVQTPPIAPAAARQPVRVGCVGSLLAILATLVAVAWLVTKCDGSSSRRSAVSKPSPGTGIQASASRASRPIAAGTPPQKASPFDALWKSATERDRAASFNAVFSLHLPQADYCEAYRCGDEFSREEKWKEAREEAARIRAGTWRADIPQEKTGLLTGKDGFALGSYDAHARAIPVQLKWPWTISGTLCAPRRPGTVMVSLKGEAPTRIWDDFTTTATKLAFDTTDNARAFKEGKPDGRRMRLVFKVTGATVDVRKVARYGETVDEGAGAVALIKILGYQLRDGERVIWEQPATAAK